MIAETIEGFNANHQSLVNQINFISDEIVPRYEGRPAVFNSLVQFKSSDDLAKDDVCIVFREIEDIDNESYVEIYRVDKISNRPNETYEPLNNNLLGGFKISTTSETAMALEKKEDRVKVVSSLNETGNTGIWLIKNANGTINTMKIEGVTTLFVSQSEKNSWNAKAEKSDIPKNISDFTQSPTYRTVTDTEKSNWNNKVDKTVYNTKITEYDTKITEIETQRQLKEEKGKASGYAGLDSSGKVPRGQLPNDLVLGNYTIKFNSSTNTLDIIYTGA